MWWCRKTFQNFPAVSYHPVHSSRVCPNSPHSPPLLSPHQMLHHHIAPSRLHPFLKFSLSLSFESIHHRGFHFHEVEDSLTHKTLQFIQKIPWLQNILYVSSPDYSYKICLYLPSSGPRYMSILHALCSVTVGIKYIHFNILFVKDNSSLFFLNSILSIGPSNH